MRNDKLAAFDDSAQNSQGYLSSLMINESELNSYMVERDASEHANVKPASEFLNELITFFNSDSVYSGASLPWQKTHEQFRLRPGEVTLWAGFNGSGKSLVLGQIMLHLLKDQKACIQGLIKNYCSSKA